MADTDDMNLIRVAVLGRPVDESTTWTTGGPAGGRNALADTITERVITRLLNNYYADILAAGNATNGFASRFNAVVGDEGLADEDAFAALGGRNLLQVAAALVTEPGAMLEPPDDGEFYVRTREPGEPAGSWWKLPEGGAGLAFLGFVGPPPPLSLEPRQLGLQYDGDPVPTVWVGVPLSVDPTGRRILYPPPGVWPPTPPGEGTIWDGGATIWDNGTTTWDIGVPPSGVVLTTWDGGATRWDGGNTYWDVATVWNDGGVITTWDAGQTLWVG